MTSSGTFTNTQSFTATHAKHLAAKVATDLLRIQRFYHEPNNELINNYEKEINELLKNGYLEEVTYGFIKNGKFIEPAVRYYVNEYSNLEIDNDPGKIRPQANISGASFGSFLIYSEKWFELAPEEREKFKGKIPIKRSTGEKPGLDGHFESDKTYSSGGKSINRSSLKS